MRSSLALSLPEACSLIPSNLSDGGTDKKSMEVLCKPQILSHMPRGVCPRGFIPIGLGPKSLLQTGHAK